MMDLNKELSKIKSEELYVFSYTTSMLLEQLLSQSWKINSSSSPVSVVFFKFLIL
jgi:hypothetical protein